MRTLSDGSQAMVLKCPVTGVTTSGSVHPRTELREMNGSSEAAWGSNDGKTHTLEVTQTVTHLAAKTKRSAVL